MPFDVGPGGRRWLIGGRIQGVGFRPFVFTLASELGLSGSVRNLGGQVEIVANGDADEAAVFLSRLLREHPPIARPELVSAEACAAPGESGFRILPSLDTPASAMPAAEILADQSVCAACLAELLNPASRRFRYPFIACTQCGPRYTIAGAFPFDRRTTAMAGFPLCGPCQLEYDDPTDRRFHAQVTACADCGPRLRFRSGSRLVAGNEPALARAIAVLRDGAILAVRGLGGYHLLCDAANDAAVRCLRARKRRPTKPLAVMFPRAGRDGLDRLRVFCAPDPAEAESLAAPDRPIVLVPLRADRFLSPALAPGLRELGAFLPYTPLHELLLGGFGGPVVATSGNVSGQPVMTEPDEAERRLGPIADAFLHHDRPILRPADDGVVRIIAGHGRPLRLGRGGAPLARSLPRALPQPVLALGGQIKATLTLGFGASAVISPHIGDLDSPSALDLLEATASAMQRLHGVRVETLLCDAHPGCTGARWARRQNGMRVIEIFHHHAHAAAIAGEFAEESRWLCFTWDASGLGPDGTLWGGEALLGCPGDWRRVATFRPFFPPGGEKAAREPWRSAAALAWDTGLDWEPPRIDSNLAQAAWQRRLNCPATSSVGRLFDAAASLLGLVQHAGHEGEGPMAVEAAATGKSQAVDLPLQRRADGAWQTDWAPLVGMLLEPGCPRASRAAAFHASLARALLAQAEAIRQAHGEFAVGLGGGVFQNRRLSEAALGALEAAGFRAYLPRDIPCNDGGLSFGQVVEAAAAL